ncbi:MAG: starch-binding protein [Bacteroidales bacterium]|nr:starch-binding protein [Bacteroidales bacterium]
MKSVTTKICKTLLLALIAALASSNAWAITINVNASQAPYVYAWDNDQNPLLDPYPGTQLTNVKKVGNKTWYYIDIDASTANIILSFGSDATKTGDIYVNGNRYFDFANNDANNVTDYYDMPNGVQYETTPFTYVVNTRNWGDVYAYAWGNGYSGAASSWPGAKMTKVGTNGNGKDVYKWMSDSQTNPANVIFHNNSGEQSPDKTWANGALWSNHAYDYQMTLAGAVLNSTDFPDANLRKAITASTGIAEGGAITTDNIKVLDISYDTSKGMTGKIADPTGIEKFTALEELYSHNNSLSYLDLTHTSTLRILDVSGDDALYGMRGVSYCNTSGHGVNVKGNNNFKKLIADDCPKWEYNAGLGTNNTNYQYITSLEYISERNNPLDGWSSGFNYQTGLKYLDITNTGQNVNHATSASRISVTGFTNLETLILTNNTDLCSGTNSYLDLTHNTNLKYLDLSNTGVNETKAKTTLNTVALSNLETLIINSNSSLKYAYTEKLSNLKHFEIADGDLYFTSTNQLSTLTPANNPNLEYLDISNAKISSSANPIDGFQNLKTVIAGSNPSMPKLTINNCPAIENIDISNNTSETILSITNSGLTSIPSITATGATSLYKLDLTGNAFTDVPTTGIASLTTLVMNNNQLSDLNVSESNIKYLYAQSNNFGGGEYEMPQTSLVGLDLGNNGFTKFKMTGNTTLKSLALSDNDALTEIELHGNTQLTQTSPNGIIESDNGLYIKGLSGLQTLNIENSSFNKLGQQNSLQGVTGLTKLQARNNKFTTFTNGVNPVGVTGTGSYRIADPTESSLEHLTALEYLDLAYNELCDSVHLYKNVALKHLDVSHNNHITGVYDGSITTEAQKTAMLEKKARHLMKYGNVYGAVGTNATEAQWEQGYTKFQKLRSRPFDLRTEDLNDTTGLYHLDLGQNVNLEWLDFSYTNIHHTASKPEMMNTGWMNKDWVTDMGTFEAVSSVNTTSKRAYTSWHTYVYFIPCSKLKVIHADHNNMQSLGIRYFPELDTLTCSYMYGDCAYMRDFSSNSALSVGTNAISDEAVLIGMGNISLSTTVQKLKSVTWSTDNKGNPTSTLTWEGPDGADNTYYCNPIKYYDVSYSGFNEIRFYPGSYFTDLPNLEYVNVSGNPLNFQVKHYNGATLLDYSNVSNYNSLDLTYCPNIKTVLADNCSYLPTVRAYNRDALTTLDLTNDPQLKTVYAQDDAMLQSITGLSTLTGLETLFAYNNTQFGGIDVSSNTALKNLWVSNIKASSIDVSHNAALEKLRVYDNLLEALNVSNNPALTWLDVARNKIPSLDLSANAALQYFNCSNSEETLNDLSLTQNNHNGAEGDSEKPASGTAKASNGGNNLSDLVFPGTAIADVRANYNDLHCIKPGTSGSFANLTHIEFAHNHINGIDLSAATGLTPADVIDEDNGRAITAECAKFIKHGTAEEVTVYYFQLENIKGQQLTGKTSIDSKNATRYLGEDGFELAKISEWDGTNAAPYIPATTGISPKDVTIDPSNMADYLGADVEGTVVVLKEDAQHPGEGRATYSYNNGVGNSTFYLDWEANADLPTAINVIEVGDGLSIAGSYGGMTIAGADGTVIGVYDMSGRQVASETISGGKATITGLTPGIYVVNGQKVVVK